MDLHNPTLESSSLTHSRNNKGPKPATAAKATANGAGTRDNTRGRGRGGRRGRNAGRAKPKTADELDAEMTDYFDTNAANGGVATNGAVQPVANGADDLGMDEISVCSFARGLKRTWLTESCSERRTLWSCEWTEDGCSRNRRGPECILRGAVPGGFLFSTRCVIILDGTTGVPLPCRVLFHHWLGLCCTKVAARATVFCWRLKNAQDRYGRSLLIRNNEKHAHISA